MNASFAPGSSTSTSSRTFNSAVEGAPEVAATPIQISAAPQIEEFRPPSPTPTDPYPGYYQLPSGAWAAHDPEYYKAYYNRWQKEYEAHIRSLEKRAGKERHFEGATDEATTDVRATDQLDEARHAREETMGLTKKALLENEPKMPKMSITPSKMSGVARSRHQLGTLLMEAYTNREALEERIAQGKRNRKEAGNKYGTPFIAGELVATLHSLQGSNASQRAINYRHYRHLIIALIAKTVIPTISMTPSSYYEQRTSTHPTVRYCH
jgi:hypothetical protein